MCDERQRGGRRKKERKHLWLAVVGLLKTKIANKNITGDDY